MSKLIVLRRCSQVVFLAFFIFILWSTTYPLKGAISPSVIFRLDPLIMLASALCENVLLPGISLAFLMVILTLFWGRFFCGWVCPMGTIIDWFGRINHRNKIALTDKQRRFLSRPKFVVLILIFLLALTGRQAAWVWDPVVMVARVISLNVIPAVTSGIDRVFQFLIPKFNLYGAFYDYYRSLKEGLLGINVYFFANSLSIFLFFLVVCSAAILVLRLWCRLLCPLGAWYAWNSRLAFLGRHVTDCNSCGKCVKNCRMGAIESGNTYRKGECILCMDCVYDCPQGSTDFRFGHRPVVSKEMATEEKMSRGHFLLMMLSAFGSLGFKFDDAPSPLQRSVIRPPGALPEEKFVNVCVRCGNCMKVCLTNGLQPVIADPKWSRLWTPQLVPEIGYCEYNCTLCGEVCPTGAIPRLKVEQKRQAKMGLAVIDRSLCYAWGGNKECLVCEEHCPVAEKAIKRYADKVDGRPIDRPVVDANACIGCGICQNKCPVRPFRAIRVQPVPDMNAGR